MVTKDLRNEVFDLIYGKDRIEEAILKLNGIIKSSPENSRAIALKAYALNKLANLHKAWKYSQLALEFAERALSLNPNDDIALTSKGWGLIDLGRANEALAALNQATRLNPNNEYAWYNLAWPSTFPGTHSHQQNRSEGRLTLTLTVQS